MKRSKRKYRRNYNMLAKKYAEGGQITGSLDQFARADENVDTFQEKLLDIHKAMLGQETETQFGANLASAVDAGRAVGNTFMNVSTLGLINPEEMESSLLGNFQMAQMGGPINKYVNGTEVDYVTSDSLYDPFDPNDPMFIGTPPILGNLPTSTAPDGTQILTGKDGLDYSVIPGGTADDIQPFQNKKPFDWMGMLSQLSQSGALNNLGQQSPLSGIMGTLGQGVNQFKQAMDSGNTDRNIEAMGKQRNRVDDLKRIYGGRYNKEVSRGTDPRMQSYIQDLEGASTGDIFQKSSFQKMMELTQGAAQTGNQVFNQASDGIGNAIGGILGGIFGAENGGMVPNYQNGGPTGKPSTYMDALASMPQDSIINSRYPSDTDVAMSRLEEMFPFLQYSNKDYSREEYQKAMEGAKLYLNAPMTDQKRIEREENTVAAKPLTFEELFKINNTGYYRRPIKMDETGLRPETPDKYKRNSGAPTYYKDGGTVADYRNEDKLAEMQMAMSEPTPNAPTSGMQIDPMTGGIMIPEDFEGAAKLKGAPHSEGGIPVFTPAEGQGIVETEMEGDEIVDVEDGETFVFPKGKHTKEKEKREAEAMKLKEMLNDPKVQKDMFKVATIERRLQTLETEEKAHREQIIQEKRAKEQAEVQERAEMDQMLAEGKYISQKGTYRQGGKVRSLTEAQKARLSEVYADVPDSYQDGSEVENKELSTAVSKEQLNAIYDEAWSNIDNQFGYSKKEVDSGEAASEFARELNKIFKRDKITGVALRDYKDPTRVEIKDSSGIYAPTGGKDLENKSLLYSFKLPVNTVGKIPGQLFNKENLPILEKAKKDFVDNLEAYSHGFNPGLRNLLATIPETIHNPPGEFRDMELALRKAQYEARGWALDDSFEQDYGLPPTVPGTPVGAPGSEYRKKEYEKRGWAPDETLTPEAAEQYAREAEELRKAEEEAARRASITPDPIDPITTPTSVSGGSGSSGMPPAPTTTPVTRITPEPKERPTKAPTTTGTDFSKNIPQPNQGFGRRNYEITPGDRLGMSILQSAPERMRDITVQNMLATDPNINFYENIGQRAEDTLNAGLESIYASKEQAGSRIGSDFKAALNTIRNASNSYSNMAARANSLYDSKENARLKSDLTYDQTAIGQKNKLAEMQKYTDTMRAKGDEQRDLRDREDIDNYYTQLAQNESLAQQLGMQQAQSMNQSYLNQLLANVQSSMNQYGYDAQGNVIFKPPGGQQPKQQCPEGMTPCFNGNGCYNPNVKYFMDPCTQRNTPGGFGGDFNTFLQEMLKNRGIS